MVYNDYSDYPREHIQITPICVIFISLVKNTINIFEITIERRA